MRRAPLAAEPLGKTPEPDTTREELWSELREASVLRFEQSADDLESEAAKLGKPRRRNPLSALAARVQSAWQAAVYRYLKTRVVRERSEQECQEGESQL